MCAQFLVMKGCEYLTTLTPNIGEDEALLCRPRRRNDGRAINLLAKHLAACDFEDLESVHRLEIIESVGYLCLESTRARKFIEKGVEEGAKLTNRKREEFAARMKDVELEHRGGYPMTAGERMALEFKSGADDEEEGQVKKKVKLDVASVRECQAEEGELLEQVRRLTSHYIQTCVLELRERCLQWIRHHHVRERQSKGSDGSLVHGIRECIIQGSRMNERMSTDFDFDFDFI